MSAICKFYDQNTNMLPKFCQVVIEFPDSKLYSSGITILTLVPAATPFSSRSIIPLAESVLLPAAYCLIPDNLKTNTSVI
jgi:hypothetical protein